MTLTCSTLLVFALPHRASRAVFSYLETIVATADAGTGRWRLVLVNDPDRVAADGDLALYLRAGASLDALPLVRAAAFPADPELQRAHAFALACDQRWHHHPVLTIEDATSRELHAAVRLSTMLGFALSGAVLEVALAGFGMLQADIASTLNAAALFATMDDVSAYGADQGATPTRPPVDNAAVLERAGFAPIGVRDDEGQRSATLDRLMEDRPAHDVLVVSNDATAAVGANGDALAGRSVAGISLGRPSAPPASTTTFHHVVALDGNLPPLEGASFGLVFLHELARLPTPTALLAWVMDALAPWGMICGQERDAADVERTLGTLTRPESVPGLVVTIEGLGWTAIRQAFWAS